MTITILSLTTIIFLVISISKYYEVYKIKKDLRGLYRYKRAIYTYEYHSQVSVNIIEEYKSGKCLVELVEIYSKWSHEKAQIKRTFDRNGRRIVSKELLEELELDISESKIRKNKIKSILNIK